jgi:hypothetical protein
MYTQARRVLVDILELVSYNEYRLTGLGREKIHETLGNALVGI